MNKFLNFVFVIVLSFFLGMACCYFVFDGTKNSTANEIFNSSASSIVEIKAITDSVGESFGTGICYNKDGFLVTNAHVVTYSKLDQVNQFEKYYVRFINENEFVGATLVKYDIEFDLAILKIENSNITHNFIKFQTAGVEYGQQVFAIGNTSNYGIGISDGLISIPLVNVIYEDVSRLVIQVDINISTGNSGGALLNSSGELIGITTFRTKDLNGNVNYGFVYCIPTSIVSEYIGG